MKVAELPTEDSDIFQATEPLPETPQERLKRCRKAQGQNNQAKRQCLTKLEARDGLHVCAKADKKYAANTAKVFTSTSKGSTHCHSKFLHFAAGITWQIVVTFPLASALSQPLETLTHPQGGIWYWGLQAAH
jgi:hypothetical protein